MLIYSSLPKIEDIETMRRNRGGEMFRKNRIVWLKKRGRDKKDKEGLQSLLLTHQIYSWLQEMINKETRPNRIQVFFFTLSISKCPKQ